MHEGFIVKFNALRNEYLLKTEYLFAQQRQKWVSDFAENFQKICAEVVRLQEEESYPPVSHIECTILFNNFIDRRYVAEVFVYGESLYLDKNQCMAGEYDVSYLFVYFDELWDKLLAERKRYVGKVSALEVKSMILGTLPDFYSYLANIARFAIEDCDKKELFDVINKNDPFRVCVGEYMNTSASKPVYVERKNKNSRELMEWFSKELDGEYVFGDYSELDFSGCSFNSADFSYSRFQGSLLGNACFKNSVLTGVNFCKSQMEGCRLDNCIIHEADFSHANLRGAIFTKAQGDAALAEREEWRQAGYLPVSFKYADLTGADFTWANLAGVDFTGAVLIGANFSGATLTNADFTGADLRNAHFEYSNLADAIFDDDFETSGAVLDHESLDSLILGERFDDE